MRAIKELRESKGETQSELAKAIGVEQAAVAMWESGVANPKVDNLIKLADYFGCSIDEIAGRKQIGNLFAQPGEEERREDV